MQPRWRKNIAISSTSITSTSRLLFFASYTLYRGFGKSANNHWRENEIPFCTLPVKKVVGPTWFGELYPLASGAPAHGKARNAHALMAGTLRASQDSAETSHLVLEIHVTSIGGWGGGGRSGAAYCSYTSMRAGVRAHTRKQHMQREKERTNIFFFINEGNRVSTRIIQYFFHTWPAG